MKDKTIIIILICVFSVIIISLLSFMIAVMKGVSFSWFYTSKNAKLILEEDIEIKDIEKIEIDLVNYDVKINVSEDDFIHMKAYGEEDSIKTTNNKTYRIEQFKKRFIGINFMTFYSPRIEIFLPINYINDIDIHTVSGDVDALNNLENKLYIKTTSGDITLKNIKDSKLETTSGDIEASDIETIDIKTVSGDIDIISGQIKTINTTSGDININNATVYETGKIKTVSGDIKIGSINDCYVEFSSVSGDAKILNNNRKSDNVLSVNTVSGDINIK